MDTESNEWATEIKMDTWITYIIVLSVSFIINTIIVKTECKNRKSPDTIFISKWLKLSPLICMGICYIYNILYFFFFIPEFCSIFWSIISTLFTLQMHFFRIYE